MPEEVASSGAQFQGKRMADTSPPELVYRIGARPGCAPSRRGAGRASADRTELPANVPWGGRLTGVDVSAAASEAFDQALTKDQVRTIVQPFFIPTIP